MTDQNKNNNKDNSKNPDKKSRKNIFDKVLEKDPFAEANSTKKSFEKPLRNKTEEVLSPEENNLSSNKTLSTNPFSKENRTKNENNNTKDENNAPKLEQESFKKEAALETPKKINVEENPPIIIPPTKDTKKTDNSSSRPKIILNNSKKDKLNLPSRKLSFGENFSSKTQNKFKDTQAPVHKKYVPTEKHTIPQEKQKKEPSQNKNIQNPPKKALSIQKLLFGFLGLGAIFIILFYIMLLWGTLSGNVSNPLFETLGMDPAGLKILLVTMTNTIFGIVSLVFLIMTLIFLFKGIMAGKNAVNRRNIFTTTGIYFVIFVLAVGLWIFLYWIITNLGTGPLIKNEDSLITTVPKNVVDLDSPVRVEFDVSEKLSKIIPLSQVRQINWDFNEDGIFDASGKKVSHRFLNKGTNNGIYKVKAFISYFSEKTKKEELYETSKQVIINNESVLAVISASPESGTYPLKVELSAEQSSDPDGEIVWYEWDLDNDGTFELRKETPLVNKTFETVGEHKVVLRVTGTNTDDYDVTEKIIKVKNPVGSLRAEIGTDGVTEGYAPLKVTFDGSMSFVKEGKIVRYEWITEDKDEPFVGRKMQKVFRTPGEHVVRLIVENDLGERHETKKIIKILEDDAISNLVIETTPALIKDQEILRGIVPFEVTFNAEKSEVKNAFEWQWDFQSDGIVDEFAVAAKHIFRKPGTYDVKLIIVDANEDLYEKIQRVIVEPSGVRAKITATPNAGEVPLQIAFDGAGSSTDEGTLVDYIWEFPGAEPIHYGAKISYLFKQIGNFPVKLTILTSTGKVSTTETIVSVRAPNIRSEFIFSPKVGSAPLNVTFNPTSSKGLVKEYLWNFGDGSLKKQYRALPVEHTYKKEGKYTVKLRLVDANGIVSTSEQTVEVRPAR